MEPSREEFGSRLLDLINNKSSKEKHSSLKELFAVLLEQQHPMDITIEQMEAKTIGFKCEFLFEELQLIFYCMNAKLAPSPSNAAQVASADAAPQHLTPILFLIKKDGKLAKVKFLSTSSRYIGHVDAQTGNSIVHYACFWGLPTVLRTARKLGVSTSAKNAFGKSPLEIAFLKRAKEGDACFSYLK